MTFDIPRLLKPDIRLSDFAAPPRLPYWASYAAQAILDSKPAGTKVLAVHGDTSSDKMWERDKFQVVLDAFLKRRPEFLAFLVGHTPLDLDRGPQRDRIVPCFGLPLETSCALVAQSDLFLGVDSCMLHVADLFRVPGVGLFGPTSPKEFGFMFSHHRHVQTGDTMVQIEPFEVLTGLESLLDDRFALKHVAAIGD